MKGFSSLASQSLEYGKWAIFLSRFWKTKCRKHFGSCFLYKIVYLFILFFLWICTIKQNRFYLIKNKFDQLTLNGPAPLPQSYWTFSEPHPAGNSTNEKMRRRPIINKVDKVYCLHMNYCIKSKIIKLCMFPCL